jgi:hypothetical protein
VENEQLNQQHQFLDRQLVQVMGENQFFTLMDTKTQAREWTAIDCIQTCIKTNLGLGKHLPIHFSMQVDLDQ